MLQFCSHNNTWIGLLVLLKMQKQIFRGEKIKMTKLHYNRKKVQTDTPTNLFSQKYPNFGVLKDFENFNYIFFCHFLFSIKKTFFLFYKLTFVSPITFCRTPRRRGPQNFLFTFVGPIPERF